MKGKEIIEALKLALVYMETEPQPKTIPLYKKLKAVIDFCQPKKKKDDRTFEQLFP